MKLGSRIIGVGSYLPEKIVTNFDLEKMMETSDDWIVQRTGIHQRHWVRDDQTTSDLALIACERAIEKAKLDKAEINMLIVATLSPDHEFPGLGPFLQAKLNLPEIAVLDIRQQCSGFLYALSIADNFIKSGGMTNILVVGAEIHSKGLDKSPSGRNVGVLFGDGAGAVVVQKCQVNSQKDPHIIDWSLFADGRHAKNLWVPAPGMGIGPERLNSSMLEEGLHYPQMDGKTVFVHATKKMSETLSKLCAKNQIDLKEIDLFLFHQANLRINQKVAEMLQIPEEKVFNTIGQYANTTAATIPLGMDTAIKEGKLRPGMLVASAAFGSGFTWASLLLRY